MEGDGLEGVRHADEGEVLRKLGHAEGDADDGHDQDGIEEGTAHLECQEDGTQDDTAHGNQRRGRPRGEGRHRGIVGYDDTAILQSDEGDEKADTHRDGVTQIDRDGIDDGFAHT